MAIDSVAALLDTLRQSRLLEPAQIDELARRTPADADPREVANGLIERGLLTAFQVTQLLRGQGRHLLVGSYVLLELLGEGGMGRVFKARNWMLGQVVALKFVRKERVANPEAVRRFLREVRAAGQINHPHIVRAYDAGEVRGTYYLAMEFVDGTDLARVVNQDGPLPIATVCGYVRQAALGLQHAHETGLVHRDVKPHNLLVTADGAVVKLLDLGLARQELPDEAHLTREGDVMGTADYMAPEQAREPHAVDGRADLYGLGCTLYFLLTGQPPFPGGTAMHKLTRHQFEEAPSVERLRPDVPAELAGVVRRLMAKRPEERYQTPAELADVLAGLVGLTPEPAGKSETLREAPRPAPRPPAPRRRRGPVIAAVVGVVVLGTVGAIVARLAWPRPTTPPTVERPFQPTSFRIYYGKEPATLERLVGGVRPGQLLVVNARTLEPEQFAGLLRAAEGGGARVLAYLSVGELHEGDEGRFVGFLRTYLTQHPSEPAPFRSLDTLTLERNPPFKTRRIDVLAGAWRAFLLAEVRDLYARGAHGLFLDTVDTVDRYSGNRDWPLDRRAQSVTAMMDLLRAIKEHSGDRFVLQNGGLNLVGATVFVGDETGRTLPALDLAQPGRHNPDGVLWENAFARTDDWSRIKFKELQAIQQSGRAVVFALGYQATLGSPEAFRRQGDAAGFVLAWARSSTRLHEEVADAPPR